MKRYNLSKIMKEAHQIKKYMKLYSLTHGVKNWADCLKLAWANEKKRASDEEMKNAEKEAMEAYLAEPARRIYGHRKEFRNTLERLNVRVTLAAFPF